jgi:hypothetical protein
VPRLIFDALSIDLTTIKAAFQYCDVIIDVLSAKQLWQHLNHRNAMGWINAGLFTGRGAVNGGFTLYDISMRIYRTVYYITNSTPS